MNNNTNQKTGLTSFEQNLYKKKKPLYKFLMTRKTGENDDH
jgi:hypothetical protein